MPDVSPAVTRFDPLVLAAATRYQIPAALIRAIIHAESRPPGNPLSFNPEPGSPGGPSRGLMQIQEATARGLGLTGKFDRLYDPAVNIDLGSRLLRQLWDRFAGDVPAVVAAYNAGPRVVMHRTPAGFANQPYVSHVLGLAERYGLVPMIVGPSLLLVVLLLLWWRSRKRGP